MPQAERRTARTEGMDGGDAIPICEMGGNWSSGKQPVTFGVPLPEGFASPETHWAFVTSSGTSHLIQTENLVFWQDGSVKWLSLVAVCSRADLDDCNWKIWPVRGGGEQGVVGPTRVSSEHGQIMVECSSGDFRIGLQDERIFSTTSQDRCGLAECRLVCTDEAGREGAAVLQAASVEDAGPSRTRISFDGKVKPVRGLEFKGEVAFYSSTGLVRLQITVMNSQRAKHPGGYWDLGDPGSVFLRDLSIELTTTAGPSRKLHWIDRPGARTASSSAHTWEIFQASSGGENWASRNHIDRTGRVPLAFRGYRVRTEDQEERGFRASPVLTMEWDRKGLSLGLEEFWQQFPSALEAKGSSLFARLLPGQSEELHEIQAGEQNTRVLWLKLGPEAEVTPDELCMGSRSADSDASTGLDCRQSGSSLSSAA